MSAVATAPSPPASRAPAAGQRLFESGGDTLEERILAAWNELVGAGRTECPVCSGAMSAAAGCADCGAELS